MKLLLVLLLTVFLASTAAHPYELACGTRAWDGTATFMGATPTKDSNDRSIDSVGGVDCEGTLQAYWEYDVSFTVPDGYEHALEVDDADASFRAGVSGCTNRITSPSAPNEALTSTAKVFFTTVGTKTMRLMAASGQGVNVGAAPECTYTVVEATNDPNKRVYLTSFGASTECAAASAFMITSYPSGDCIETPELTQKSMALSCGPNNGTRKEVWASSDCSGSGTSLQIEKTECNYDGTSHVMHSCDEPSYPGHWWVSASSASAEDTCNDNHRTALKSGYCRDEDDGSKAMYECNADGSYSSKEGCNAGCTTCDAPQTIAASSCQALPSVGTQFYDLACTSGEQTVGALLAMERNPPSTPDGDDAGDDASEQGGDCPAGGLVVGPYSSDGTAHCIPTCANREAVARCLDDIEDDSFVNIPTLAASVTAGKPCEYIDAIKDHAARCFGSYLCCDDWDATVKYWKTMPNVRFDACTFPADCITGCTATEPDGIAIQAPCFPTCSADAQLCVEDVIAQGDAQEPVGGWSDAAACASVTLLGPAIADCFAVGGCCSDMALSVALWESTKGVADACGSTSPFPKECVEAAHKVLLSVSLPIAIKAAFTTEKRLQFRQGLAAAAGGALHQVVITKVTEVDLPVTRRRLLAATLKVDTAIAVADAAAAAGLVASEKLSAGSLAAAFNASGLQLQPTIATAPQAVVHAPSFSAATRCTPASAPPELLLMAGALASLAFKFSL